MDSDHQYVINAISDVLFRPQVKTALESQLTSEQRNRLTEAIERMRRKLAYVAVIGSQGVGKSSLLNALLFTRRVLPIGEGVTTSIVCSIHDAKESKERCEVTLLDRGIITTDLNHATLQEYMDESHNPKNIKGVQTISCFVKSDLLVNNVSFVDTPGLGADWRAETGHDKRTMAFVPDISLGLFVIRTTPTLRKAEADYLQDIWPLCPQFLFVQNVWGESPDKVADSMRENEYQLSKIAKAHGDSRPISIFPVDIHAGLERMVNGEGDAEDLSGLDHLRRHITSRIDRGGRYLEIQTRSHQILFCLELAIQACDHNIKSSSLTSEPEIERLREDLVESEKTIQNAKARYSRQERDFRNRFDETTLDFKDELRISLDSVLEKYLTTIRREGGHKGIEQEYLGEIRSAIGARIENVQRRLTDKMCAFVEASESEMGHIQHSVCFAEKDVSDTVKDVSDSHAVENIGSVTKWVGQTSVTALTALSVTGFGASITGGGTVMGGVAAGMATIPGAGWVIAAGILAAGYILQMKARNDRKDVLINEFTRIARDISHKVIDEVSKEALSSRETITKQSQKLFRDMSNQQEKVLKDIRENLSASQERKQVVQKEAAQMIANLKTAIADIEKMVQVVGKPTF